MKRDGFQRTVRPQPTRREIGNAPGLGRLGRVFGKEFPKGMLRMGRRGVVKDAESVTHHTWSGVTIWTLVFAAIVLTVVIGLMWLSLNPKSRGGNTTAKDKTGNIGNTGNGTRIVSRFPSPLKDTALNLVERALLIRDPAKVPEYFRIDSATPAEVVEFLAGMAATDGPITDYGWLSNMDANGLLIDGVVVNTRNGDQKRTRLAFLTPDDKGRWRIDFEAFARTVTPSWGEIISGRASQGVVRVQFARDNYFNGPYADDAQWACFRMGSPDLKEDEVIMGYCRTDSPQAVAMKLILASSASTSRINGPFRATLEIRHAEGAELRQFEISRVLAEDWVRSSEPFDRTRD